MQSVLGIHHQHSLTGSSGNAGYGIQACVADQGIHVIFQLPPAELLAQLPYMQTLIRKNPKNIGDERCFCF